MMTFIDHVKHSTQFRWNKVHKFQPKVSMHIEVGPYVIKTVENSKELVESFRLRHEVFYQEFRGLSGHGYDFDKFDYYFDHLVIVQKESERIIGTYRLNCSKFSKESYTELEFDLSILKLHQGPYLELGRACIHKDFRKGAVINLLWRGIAEYMNQCGAILLFGCSSLKINNAREAALVYKYLFDKGLVSHEFLCRPTKKFTMKEFDFWYAYFRAGLSTEQIDEAESLMPSLLKSYLKLGAQVACEPAFDKEFDCIDLLTILKKENLANSLAEKFKVVR